MFEIIIITLGCFIAAFINAAFATGGVYIMLAFVSSVLPLTLTITLLPVLALPSLFARVCMFWQHIHWKIVKAFVIGSAIGVFIGGQIFVTLGESYISILIACLILFLTWWPQISLNIPQSNTFLFVGAIHSFIGTLFGIGGLLQPTVLRTSLHRTEVTGTLAACLFTMDIFKISSYVSNGVSYSPHLTAIFAAVIAGFTGAWLGKRTSIAISQDMFRIVFKVIISLVAIKLLYKGITL